MLSPTKPIQLFKCYYFIIHKYFYSYLQLCVVWSPCPSSNIYFQYVPYLCSIHIWVHSFFCLMWETTFIAFWFDFSNSWTIVTMWLATLQIWHTKEILVWGDPIPWFDETPCLKKLTKDSFNALTYFSTTKSTTTPSSCSSFNVA